MDQLAASSSESRTGPLSGTAEGADEAVSGAAVFEQHETVVNAQVAQGQNDQVTVRNVSGEVVVISVDGTQGPVVPGQKMGPGDVILTRGDGALELATADGTTIFFDSESRVLIEEPATLAGKPQFFVVQGEFSVDSTGGPDAPGSELLVRTPVASVTVRDARMIGKAAPEAQANTFVLLPGIAGALAGSIAVASSGAPVIIDQPLQGLQVVSLFRDPSLLTDVNAATLTSEFGDGVLAYSDVGAIAELADTDDLGVFGRLSELFGIGEAQAEPLLIDTQGLLDGEEGSDDVLSDDGDDVFDVRDNDDEELVLDDGGDDGNNNVTFEQFDGALTISIADGDFQITGGAGDDTLTIQSDPVNETAVLFVSDDAGRAVLDFDAPTDSNIIVDEVETIAINLGSGGDTVTIGDLSNTDISQNTVRLDLGAGNDTVEASAIGRSMDISAGSGDDLIASGDGNDRLDGGADTDTVDYTNATAAVDVDLSATSATGFGNDTLTNFENVIGSAFDDTLAGDAGDNRLDGGGGADTADFSGAAAAVNADLFADTATGDGTDTLTAIENLIGSAGDDTLTGDGAANVIAGGLGNDSMDGAAGIDTADYSGSATAVSVDLDTGLATGEGNDTLIGFENATGSAQDDVLAGNASANVLTGNAGDDTLAGAGGADVLAGGDGTDTADFSALVATVTVDLDAGSFSDGTDTGTLSSIENVIGSGANDSITGDANANDLRGSNGADTLAGAGGDDTLQGEVGNDRLSGGAGDDLLDGGAGDDTADFGATTGGVTVDLATGEATGEGTDTLVSIERVEGGSGADSISGDANANTLSGAAGDDTLNGLGGDDRFGYSTGENGNDLIFGGDGAGDNLRLDLLDPSGSNVTISDDGNGDVLVDMIAPLNQSALLDGVEIVSVIGADGDDVLIIDDLSGTEIGNGGIVASLGGGADSLNAADATTAVSVDGGAGNDTLVSGAGADTLAGGDGTDLLDFGNFGGAVTVDLAGGTANSAATGTDQISGFEDVRGGAGADSLTGDAQNNGILGGAGADTISGGAGNDTLLGDAGNDVIDGGAGDDSLLGDAGNDTVSFASAANAVSVDLAEGNATGDGNDTLIGFEAVIGSANDDTLVGSDNDDTLDGGAGNDDIDGGAGTDTASYATSAVAVTASLETGIANSAEGSDFLRNIDNLIGTSRGDSLTGNGEANVLDGGAGGDRLTGGAGDDTLLGNTGGDTLVGGLGDDFFDGGVGTDTADFSASVVAVNVDLTGAQGIASGEGNDTLVAIERILGSNANDTISGAEAAENLQGRSGDDSILGNGGNDTLIGAAGADTLDGGAGDDSLSGGNDNDLLQGGIGNDTLDGESGSDVLTGGDGNDAFFYDTAENHQDVITDFLSGTDRFLIDQTAFGNIAANGSNNLIDGQSFFAVGVSLADGAIDLGNAEASFVFDSDDNLHFDPDGGTTENSFQIATVTDGNLSATDFEVQ
ncbi:beta strand repeat-containing protein [Minwuia sp.]|uniref:beta strand repeat-containing protein n=1 Tax=Minwuia sp. TaxID=2493630 RepID=UPI003A90207D